MHIVRYLFVVHLSTLVACEDNTSVPESTSPSGDVSSSQELSKKQPTEKKIQSKAGSTNDDFDPLEGLSLRDICGSQALSLIKWPFDQLKNNFKSLCCSEGGLPKDDFNCELDWPFSDVPSCDSYDELRNEIFARYGRAFNTPKWQQLFAEQSWYTIRSDFSDDWLSKEAQANVRQLVLLKKNKVACMN